MSTKLFQIDSPHFGDSAIVVPEDRSEELGVLGITNYNWVAGPAVDRDTISKYLVAPAMSDSRLAKLRPRLGPILRHSAAQ